MSSILWTINFILSFFIDANAKTNYESLHTGHDIIAKYENKEESSKSFNVTFDELKKTSLESLKFPLVIKPAAGFMGFGVHIIYNDSDWKSALNSLEDEIKRAQVMFEENVISSSRFLIEDYIQGEEFAIDAYYDDQGQPVILNIFQHPYIDSKDVRNRIYMTSVGIMIKYMARFAVLLKQIGDRADIRNLAVHMEVRVTQEEEIVQIEVNPLRFSGWCTTDVARYAWGINVYEYFMNNKKRWKFSKKIRKNDKLSPS